MNETRAAALLIATPGREPRTLAAAVGDRLPGVDIRVWPELGDLSDIAFALDWRAPEPLYDRLPNLRSVVSLGAGVDALLARGDLADHLSIGRLAGPRLAADMAAYLVAAVTSRWQRLEALQSDQQMRLWRPRSPAPAPVVGLLGTGAMATAAARAFTALGLDVLGWNRSGRAVDGLKVFSGFSGLEAVARRSDALINLLPLTDATRDVLDSTLFAAMPRDSLLVNVGRGEHLVEADLLEALDHQRPGLAVLDSFRVEPLPEHHPFWGHPQIRITPHCAAVTSPDEAAALAAESYRRVMAGRPPLGAVDRRRQY